jgi:histidinol-phosphate/aromatic aminotransferase/cobyric acid decarboxylase-like protein
VERAARGAGLGETVVSPSNGNFVAIDLTESSWTGDALASAFMDQKVFVRSGTYQSVQSGQRFLKVSTAVPTAWAERFAQAAFAIDVPTARESRAR